MVYEMSVVLMKMDARHALKQGLASLPVPRNDYEIVVPESEMQQSDQQSVEDFIPDQSDVDANRQAALKAQSN